MLWLGRAAHIQYHRCMLKRFVQYRLKHYIKLYFKNHPDVRLVVVVGSVGKASTKHAIASVLSQHMKVGGIYDTAHTADELEVPLEILGIDKPDSRSIVEWYKVLRAARSRAKGPATVDVIVQDLGFHRRRGMKGYKRYLRPDLAVVTSVTQLDMKDHATIDQIAQEELTVTLYARYTLINRDDVDGRYAQLLINPNISTYGSSLQAEYSASFDDIDQYSGSIARIETPELEEPIQIHTPLIGEHSMRPLAAAVGVATLLGVDPTKAIQSASEVTALPGRMNPLRGIDGTLILDDTESAGPVTTADALQALYRYDTASQRIAVLGELEDFGAMTIAEHQHIGALCNCDLLAWVVTVGEMANRHIGTPARSRGCQVRPCRNAIEAAEFVRSVTEGGAVILVTGASHLYLEETVKVLCDHSEEHKLIRQSPQWQAIKDEQFSLFPRAK
ncbi:hypothetical protein CR983_03005 [Candidatus Saccharibacteria bacterium]|nr:MAG: hypothetical protein CR983_03005 [Candidatus Saccharibacteria bacterium]